MEKSVLLLLAAVIAGYLLINIPLATIGLSALGPVVQIIGVIVVLVFSLVLIFRAVLSLIGK